jgi:hypothetical protein
MSDPRFQSGHLEPPRRAVYRDARGRLLAARPPSRYALVQTPGGVCLPLRVGLTAIGRYPENDIVVERIEVSRRHCVLLAHAGGGCEVYDTASRNGTRVNGRRVGHAWLNPGDVLQLCDTRFLLVGDEAGDGPPAGPDDPGGWGTGHWDEPGGRGR